MEIDKTLKYIVYTLLGLIFLVPFIVDSSQLFPFITGKAFAFRVLVEALFFVWLILAIRNPEYRPKYSLIIAALTAFIIMIGISNVFGQNPFFSFWSNYERMEGYINLLHLFVMFVALGSTIKTRDDWNKVIATAFAISIGMLFYAFEQVSGAKAISQGGRLDATFGNPIYLSIYCYFNIFFGLYLIYVKDFLKDSWKKILIIIVVAAHLYILYGTNTRGAVLGLIGGLFLTAVLNIFNSKVENKKIWLTSIISVAAIALVVGAFYLEKDSAFVKNNKVLSRFSEISLTSGTSQARLLNWQIAYEGFKEKPILGWGMGNYSYVFDKYYVPEMYGNESWFDHVHNIVLDWLIAGGVIGFALYLILLLSLVWSIWKNPNYSKVERNIFIGLVAGYLFQNLFVFDNQTSYIYLFIIFAIFHSQNNREISIFSRNLSKDIILTVSVIILILFPVTVYYVNASGYLASKNVISSLRELAGFQTATGEQGAILAKDIIAKNMRSAKYNSFASFEVRTKGIVEPSFTLARLPAAYLTDAEKQKYIQFAFDEMTKEVKNNPEDAKTAYIMGVYLNQFGDFKNAGSYLEKAVALSPKKQVLQISLAFNYLGQGLKDKAIATAQAAYDEAGDSKINSKYDSLWVEYMRVVSNADQVAAKKIIDAELNAGRKQRVEMLLQKVIDLSPDKSQNYISLSAFYFQIGDKQKSIDTLNAVKAKFPEIATQITKLISDIEAGKNPLLNPVKNL